jgi:prepilin-type N-terminal cleavage/methylation domain-containing protein
MKRNHKGFTLIEFVVIISIFAIMAAVALFNFAGFRSNVGLTNVVQDIALTIRQAQVFGWATQTETISPDADPLRHSQGVYFAENGSDGYGKDIVLYSKFDTNPQNAMYFAGQDTNVDTLKIQGSVRVVDIRATDDKSKLKLDGDPTNLNLIDTSTISLMGSNVSVVFSRPRPEAMFFSGFNRIPEQYLGIYVASEKTCPTGTPCVYADRVITISTFGEIGVQ